MDYDFPAVISTIGLVFIIAILCIYYYQMELLRVSQCPQCKELIERER